MSIVHLISILKTLKANPYSYDHEFIAELIYKNIDILIEALETHGKR